MFRSERFTVRTEEGMGWRTHFMANSLAQTCKLCPEHLFYLLAVSS